MVCDVPPHFVLPANGPAFCLTGEVDATSISVTFKSFLHQSKFLSADQMWQKNSATIAKTIILLPIIANYFQLLTELLGEGLDREVNSDSWITLL